MTDEARKLADECWHDLIEKDDRNSPEEYPEMALISKEELAEYLARSQPGTLEREEVARKALEDCLGCLTAAESEGLHDVIGNLRGTSDDADRLIDLVERRLMWVREYAEPILALTPSHEAGTQEPVAWLDLRTADLDWQKRIVATNRQYVEANGPENFAPLYAAPQPASVAQEPSDCGELEQLHGKEVQRSVALEIERDELREAIVMAENRLEAALLGEWPCKDCVELARSYLTDALAGSVALPSTDRGTL